jgi:hypothetical protein
LNDLSEIKFKKPPLEIPEKRQKRKCYIIYPYWKNKENYYKTAWDYFLIFCLIL